MNSIRLLQFTDPHLRGARTGELRGIVTLPSLYATMAHAAHRFAAPDAVLLTGDLVQDDPAGYALIREAFAASPVPVYCIPGNHDLPAEMQRVLSGRPFQVGGHVIMGPWLIALLDSTVSGSASGRLGSDQLRELDALLTGHPGLHVLVCLHHHPVPMQSRWLDEVGLEDAREFQRVIAGHGNVRGVLWGHVHQSFDRLVRGVRFMATPATCAQFLPRSDNFAIDRRPPGYRVLELMPDGSIATEVIWLDAAEEQQLTLRSRSA